MVGRNIQVGTIVISTDLLTFSYIRSSGPGGQNVNKVSTAAQLRFDASNCKIITRDTLSRLRKVSGRRMTGAGVITITAQRFRSQERNREDAIDRLIKLLQLAIYRPKYRRQTKISKGIKNRRLDSKRRRSNIKSDRKQVGRDD